MGQLGRRRLLPILIEGNPHPTALGASSSRDEVASLGAFIYSFRFWLTLIIDNTPSTSTVAGLDIVELEVTSAN